LFVFLFFMKNNFWYLFSTFSQIGFIIAIPAALFAYFGHKLDIKFDTSPLFLISGIGIAIFVSCFAIYQMIKKIEKNDTTKTIKK